MEEWFNIAINNHAPDKPSLEIDYERYAKAEAALGWLNTFALLASDKKLNANDILTDIVNGIKDRIKGQNSEIAHLKVYAVSSLDYAKMGVTGVDEEITVNRAMNCASKMNLIINARVEMDPIACGNTEEIIGSVCKYSITATDQKLNHLFRLIRNLNTEWNNKYYINIKTAFG